MAFLIAALSSFFIAFLLLPLIIRFSRFANLMDSPDLRKNHLVDTPVLGGIAIFVGFIFAIFLTGGFIELVKIKYYLFATLIIFLMGIRDDISGLLAKNKLFAQLFAAFLIVQFSDLRLTGLYGLAGVGSMPDWFNMIFSIFVIVALTNSLNLLDGIDGLAASISILILTFFGISFFIAGDRMFTLACIALVGSLLAFLIFNWHPSKIFMGDTGSMILGFSISAFSFRILNLSISFSFQDIDFKVGVAVVLSALIVPIVDTLRVFIIRFWNGKNPLDPDRNHLHHEMKKFGFNDGQSTILLCSVNIFFLSTVLVLNTVFSDGFIIIGEVVLAMLVLSFLEWRISKLPIQKTNSTTRDQLYISKSA